MKFLRPAPRNEQGLTRAEEGTRWFWRKPYHWVVQNGRLTLKPGEAP